MNKSLNYDKYLQNGDVDISPDCSGYPVLVGGDAGVAGSGIEVTGTLPDALACTPAARHIKAKSRIGYQKCN